MAFGTPQQKRRLWWESHGKSSASGEFSSHLRWSAHGIHGILQVFGCQCRWTQQVRGESSVAQLQPKRTALGQPGFGKSIANGKGCFGCKVIRLPEVCRFLKRFWIFWGDIAASILVKLIDIIGARLYNCMDQSAMQETRAWTLSQCMGSFLAPPKQDQTGGFWSNPIPR